MENNGFFHIFNIFTVLDFHIRVFNMENYENQVLLEGRFFLFAVIAAGNESLYKLNYPVGFFFMREMSCVPYKGIIDVGHYGAEEIRHIGSMPFILVSPEKEGRRVNVSQRMDHFLIVIAGDAGPYNAL